MFPSVRVNSFRAILSFVLALTAEVAVSQTSVNDVHVTPREKTADLVATTALGNPASAYAGGAVIRTSVDLVLVPVTITDDLNRPVIGLDQDNFRLFEGKKPQEIRNFSSEDTPVSVGILVDVSGSMSYKLERARDAVIQFCEQADPQDEFFMITFADTPQLTTDFTTSAERVENDLLTARSKGQTSLLDAIYMGLRKMRDAHYARKALLVLSDGGDNHSRYTERNVTAAIKESDVMIFAVGTYDRNVASQEELLGPALLQEMAGLTGGQAFTITNENELPMVTRNIGQRLRHQYMLAYQPQSAPHDGKWHKISVKLRIPRSIHLFMHVDARPGYYAGGE